MEHRSVSYGWVVVAAAATIICVGMGALFSLGVFLVPIERSMGWSRGAISTVALFNWIAMGLGSFCWGALSDRIGGRGVALAGGFLLGRGLVLAGPGAAVASLRRRGVGLRARVASVARPSEGEPGDVVMAVLRDGPLPGALLGRGVRRGTDVLRAAVNQRAEWSSCRRRPLVSKD